MANTVSNVTIAALESLVVDSVTFGYTGAPYVFQHEGTFVDFFAEQSSAPIITQMTQRSCTSTCQAIENTPEVLAIVFNLPASNVVTGNPKVLSIDSASRGNVALTATGLAGTAPGTNKARTISCPQTIVRGSSQVGMARDDITRVDVEFTHNEDSNGLIATISDAT